MIPYPLHAGVIIAGCFIFYKILLQKETFFRLNRWMMMVCLLLAFGLPLIHVPQQWSFHKAAAPVVVQDTDVTEYSNLPSVSSSSPPVTVSPKQPSFNWHQAITWVQWLYWFGVAAFGINFLVQVVLLLFRAYTRPVIKDGRFRIVELSGDKAPCSFGNNIFINPEKYDWDTYSQILMHEKIHVQQGHSLDLLLAELVIIFQWFNPFAWLYRKELENNLEFLTDDQLLHHPEVEKTVYQLSLLKVCAPHFPLHVTTNYNQSLLKKRIAMMNVKKSNVHTTWKYLFLFPVLVLFVSLLNEPVAVAQTAGENKEIKEKKQDHDRDRDREDWGMPTEGYWFATIRDKDGNKDVQIEFKSDGDKHSTNNSTFSLSELGQLPRDKQGTFTLTREAGTIEFTGKFEDEQGMGRYKFVADKSYAEAMQKEGVDLRNDGDQMVFFMVDVKRSYVQMLKSNGYTNLKRNDLIPLAALKVDGDYIQSLKKSGLSNIELHNLIPLKALHVTGDYVDEIRKAGYPNVTVQQLISLKAQHINGKDIADIVAADKASQAARKEKADADESNEKAERTERAERKEKAEKDERKEREEKEEIDRKESHDTDEERSIHDLIAMKSLKIDADYINSLKKAGYADLSNHQLISFKSVDITADYIKSLQAAGYNNIPASKLVAIKSMNITPEYLKTFESVGYTIPIEDAIPLKAMKITPEYIKGFQSIGYKDIPVKKFASLKSQDITPGLIQEYKALGFQDVSLNDVIGAKATGTTPQFIAAMQEKGHKLSSIRKYMQLKNALSE